ncbi:phage holin family protein [Porcipelethomonas sp.]|uniref:phage holin family protein n=1 Tax=Porcipelethomonas sp. TaxID=2981675 RepID=UPI003EF9430C
MTGKFKYLISVICGLIATAAKQYGLILSFVVIGIVMDFVTGLVKCKVTGIPISSQKGYKGFWKKISLLAALFFGVFLDYFIAGVLEKIVSVELPFALPFGLIIGAYIVLNESISICENLYACNPGIMPKWIANLLKSTKEKIDEKNKGEK